MDTTFKLIAIGLYFAAMLAIGFYASHKNNNFDDYMLAGRQFSPFVAPRLRSYTEVAKNSIRIPSFLENRFRDGSHLLRIVAGAVILAYFTFYVSSGMVAGGKFFESSFGSTYLAGMFLVAGVTLAYTLFGGFLGASLTDVAQGLLMLAALLAVPLVALIQLGGWGEMVNSIHEADAALGEGTNRLSFFANGTWVGVIPALAWGLGYFGQPHIIVRFMALRSAQDAVMGRRIGIAWMALCAFGASFGPVVILALFWKKFNARGALSALVVGAVSKA